MKLLFIYQIILNVSYKVILSSNIKYRIKFLFEFELQEFFYLITFQKRFKTGIKNKFLPLHDFPEVIFQLLFSI